jgi:hypothetical protein
MNVNELLVTGRRDAANLFTIALTADGATVMRPGASAEGDAVMGAARQKAAYAFIAVRNLMDEILRSPTAASS